MGIGRGWAGRLAGALVLVAVLHGVQPAAAGEYRAQIIGGAEVAAADHPAVVYVVVRRAGSAYACTGSIIASRWVLTAGHCIDEDADVTIHVGNVDPRRATWKVTAEGVRHPSYRELPNGAPAYDVGLYHLDEPHPLSIDELTVALPGIVPAGSRTTAVGWGIDESGAASDLLRSAAIETRDGGFCRQRAGAAFEAESMVCLYDDQRFTCSGDSGGPILLGQGAQTSIVGVTSWGSPGCDDISVAAGNAALAWVHAAADLDTAAATFRIAGTDRYRTAAALSATGWAEGAENVYVTSGRDFPDALAAGPAAAASSAPILLVEPTSVPAVTAAELARLDPDAVVVVGGTAAVSEGVAEELRAITGAHVRRVAGLTRYETAVATTLDAFAGGARHLYVATGRSFQDALMAGGAASYHGGAVLLVDGRGPLEAEVRDAVRALRPARTTVVGAAETIAPSVVADLRRLGPVEVIQATEVHDRSAALWGDVAAGVPTVLLATSDDFADALAGAPYAARPPASPLLLSTAGCLPALITSAIQRMDPSRVALLGGTAALGRALEQLTAC